jgi:hypothetical protein
LKFERVGLGALDGIRRKDDRGNTTHERELGKPNAIAAKDAIELARTRPVVAAKAASLLWKERKLHSGICEMEFANHGAQLPPKAGPVTATDNRSKIAFLPDAFVGDCPNLALGTARCQAFAKHLQGRPGEFQGSSRGVPGEF